MTEKNYPAKVLRVLSLSGKSLYVQEAEWLDDKCELLKEMDRGGWPRKSCIKRDKISGILVEPPRSTKRLMTW